MMRNRAKPAPVGARALGGECMKTAPSRKTAGEEGDRAKATAAPSSHIGLFPHFRPHSPPDGPTTASLGLVELERASRGHNAL